MPEQVSVAATGDAAGPGAHPPPRPAGWVGPAGPGASRLSGSQLERASALVAGRLGLHFPPARWADLERGVLAAAGELRPGDPQAGVEGMLSAALRPDEMAVLASHLTVGETYFFRERAALDALEQSVLPELLCARRGASREVRVWSAGCCTGEEAYSVAILLHRLLPDLKDWRVTVLGTDLSPRFLERARQGVYTHWSFRDPLPGVRERYFTRRSDGRHEVVPAVRRMVSFRAHNLVEDGTGSLWGPEPRVDVVLCRNVLMYMVPEQARRIVLGFHEALGPGGWLLVSGTEVSAALYAPLEAVSFPGAIAYRKRRGGPQAAPTGQVRPSLAAGVAATELAAAAPALGGLGPEAGAVAPQVTGLPAAAPMSLPDVGPGTRQLPPAAPWPAAGAPEAPPDARHAGARALYEAGRHREAEEALLRVLSTAEPSPAALALMARILADQRRLAEALAWCERAIAADRLAPASHYLLALILQEQERHEEAAAALGRALYADPEFVLAHVALGNLMRRGDRQREAARHFGSALALLSRRAGDEVLPGGDGVTVGRLMAMIRSTGGYTDG